MDSMKDKVAIITGASAGIGAEIALYFAKQGARLSLAGRNEDNLRDVATRTGLADGDILTTVGDLVREEDRRCLIDNTIGKFGQLDILINNAGTHEISYLEEVTEEHYDVLFNTNLKSHVFLTKLAIPHLVKSKGNIVNISSTASSLLGPTLGVYTMTKVALDAYTKVLAAELGSRGVRVNAVNPGFIPATRLHERSNVPNFESQGPELEKKMCLGRGGTPGEIAQVAAFLASDLATFVTGELLYADGGMRLSKPVFQKE